jgi:soluble lytic murein transglycosylase-like protein
MVAHRPWPLPPAAVRWRLSPAVALVLAALIVASPKPGFPDSLSAGTSFDSRFAAVEIAGRTNGAPTNIVSAHQESGDNAAKRESRPSRGLDAQSRYRGLIDREAAYAGLSPEIAEAVMAVESGYNPGAIGGVGEIGLMQILPSTARMLGFVGTNSDLAVPETNIHYGVTYLAQAWRLAGGDLCTAVMKYRAGHGETRFSFLSVNYCLAVRSKLAARGFRVTGNVPVATFGEAGSAGCKRKCLGGSRLGHVNLAALNMQLSALVVQVRAAR